MNLAQRAISDLQKITSNAKEYNSIKLTAPTGETVNVIGVDTKHHLGITPEGTMISTKNSSVAISEGAIIAANPNYPLRISDTGNAHYGEVCLDKHLVDVVDSTGGIKNYIAKDWFPDERLALIIIILNDYDNL